MARHLLTPSLHDSWKWYNLMESKEKQDFLNTLLKIRETDPDALARMQRGIDFENDVRKVCDGLPVNNLVGKLPYVAAVAEIADIVRGGLWQEKAMFDLRLHGMDFLVYGKIDVRKRDFLYDIKTTGNYEAGKYTGSVQHPTYMRGTDARKFAYLVFDGDAVYREDYVMDADMDRAMLAEYSHLVEAIMDDADFSAAYLDNWKAFGEAPVAA